jgi:aminomethyltransferase
MAHGARMVDFAGWSMPVQYTSIVAEHNATRTGAGLFDISHMGRLRFSGPDAAHWIDRLVTRRASKLGPGQIVYALATNSQGGILDDVLVYRLSDLGGAPYYLMVVNASNREKIVAWINSHRGSEDATFDDVTQQWAMIAIQGPRAIELAAPLVEANIAGMKYYHGAETRIAGHGGIASRTGYTGEDGCELIVGSAIAPQVWTQLIAAGAAPAGLGCRDTLRLEAGMPLYGHELSEEINPFQAGLGFAVDLEGAQFPGADVLAHARDDRTQPVRVGLELTGKRVPREDFAILEPANARQVGFVSSGTFSPTFEKPLAMGYVEPPYSAPGTELLIDIRGRNEAARVVKLPFYRRPR